MCAEVPLAMEKLSRLFFALTVLLLLAPGSIAQETAAQRGRLSLPTKNWGVTLELPGFTVDRVETKPDGRRYMFATNKTSQVGVSLSLEQGDAKSSDSCRKSLEERAKHPPLKVKDVRYSQRGDFDLMEYTVAEFKGEKIDQKSTFACRFYDNTYIDLHVSKVKYVADDEPLFTSVMDSLRIDQVQRSSMELMGVASQLYLRRGYKGAIVPYSQALELEKGDPKLEKSLWHVLIDNLGMSYGITGELQKAKETFDYGASRDPEYPLFYYNLACTYAEMNDAANASRYLQKAFDHKAHVLPGESMPDPRSDDSFKKLMKDKEFRELAERLARGQ